MDPTGIEALDKILGGGLPRPSTIGLVGPIGSGKALLVRQIVANMLKEGFAVLFYTIDDPAEIVKNELRTMGVDVEKHEKDSALSFVDIFSRAVERVKGSYEKFEPGSSVLQSGLQFSDLVEMGRGFTLNNLKKKQIAIIDSITPLFLMSDAKEVFHYCQTLKYATRFANAIGIAVHHADVLDQKPENALFGFADGIIELKKSSENTSGPIFGTLKIDRMGDQKFLKGNFPYEIKENKIN
ncbi:MAG: RAD55 family ATPase, partial [Candidatus Bathyarchaeota archaeon]